MTITVLGGALCEGKGGEGDSEAVYLVRGSVLSLSFVESNKRDRSTRPDELNPYHVPQNVGLQDLTIILQAPKSSQSYQDKTPTPFLFLDGG